jgi:hypothetical protein
MDGSCWILVLGPVGGGLFPLEPVSVLLPAVMLNTQLVRVRYGTLSVSSLWPDCWGAFGAPMPT